MVSLPAHCSWTRARGPRRKETKRARGTLTWMDVPMVTGSVWLLWLSTEARSRQRVGRCGQVRMRRRSEAVEYADCSGSDSLPKPRLMSSSVRNGALQVCTTLPLLRLGSWPGIASFGFAQCGAVGRCCCFSAHCGLDGLAAAHCSAAQNVSCRNSQPTTTCE